MSFLIAIYYHKERNNQMVSGGPDRVSTIKFGPMWQQGQNTVMSNILVPEKKIEKPAQIHSPSRDYSDSRTMFTDNFEVV
jgi:hypothetical protein